MSFEEFSAGRGAEDAKKWFELRDANEDGALEPRGIRSRFAAAQEELTRRAITIAITTLATICLPGSPHAGAAASQPLTLSDKKVAAADQPKILLLLAADHGWLDNSVFGAGEGEDPDHGAEPNHTEPESGRSPGSRDATINTSREVEADRLGKVARRTEKTNGQRVAHQLWHRSPDRRQILGRRVISRWHAITYLR